MTNTQTDASRLGVFAAFAAIYLIWGSTYLAIRFVVEDLPPFLIASVRFLVAGSLLYVVLRLRGVGRPKRLHWRSAFIIGTLLLLGGNGLVSWSEQELPSGLVALIIGTMPMWMVLFDWVRPGGKSPGGQVLIGLGLGLVGTGVLIGPDLLAGGATLHIPSLLVVLLAPVLWSIGSIYSRHAELPESPLMSVAIEMLCGGVALLIFALITGDFGRLYPAEASMRAWLSLVYLTVFGSLIAFSAYIWLLQVTTPARAGTYAYVNPVIAVFLGWLLADETLSVRTIIAAGIIVVAVMLITTYRERTAPVLQPDDQPAAAD